MELKHVETFVGSPRPADVFQPHQTWVELLSDMDEVFAKARRMAGGEVADEAGESPGEKSAAGERGVIIVTPGRLYIRDPSPKPGSVPKAEAEEMGKTLPPDPPLQISVISYTNIEALVEDMSKAIPFRGFLISWAYIGHSVVVFEGHPSAFESGVRNSDVLLVDSGMRPFLQPDWVAVAQRVMRPGAEILVHDRETYTVSRVAYPDPDHQPFLGRTGDRAYADLLVELLVGGERPSVEITSGCALPRLADLTNRPADFPRLANLPFKYEDLNADRVIDIVLHEAGWRWYNPFKQTGSVPITVMYPDGTMREWKASATLRKDAQGRRQILIER